jgi:hypothetical protein
MSKAADPLCPMGRPVAGMNRVLCRILQVEPRHPIDWRDAANRGFMISHEGIGPLPGHQADYGAHSGEPVMQA